MRFCKNRRLLRPSGFAASGGRRKAESVKQFNRRLKKYFRLLTLYRSSGRGAAPGMCGFPFRRESGTGNRIPGDFFAYFFDRAKSKCPAGMRRPEQPVPRDMSGRRKNKRPSVKDSTFNHTVIHKIRTPGSGRNFRRVKRRIAGLPTGRRPARPLTRKLINCTNIRAVKKQ